MVTKCTGQEVKIQLLIAPFFLHLHLVEVCHSLPTAPFCSKCVILMLQLHLVEECVTVYSFIWLKSASMFTASFGWRVRHCLQLRLVEECVTFFLLPQKLYLDEVCVNFFIQLHLIEVCIIFCLHLHLVEECIIFCLHLHLVEVCIVFCLHLHLVEVCIIFCLHLYPVEVCIIFCLHLHPVEVCIIFFLHLQLVEMCVTRTYSFPIISWMYKVTWDRLVSVRNMPEKQEPNYLSCW